MVDRFMVAATDFGNPSQAVQSVRFTVMIVMTAVQNKCSVAVFAGVHAVAAPGLQPAYLVECCGFIHRTAEVLVESTPARRASTLSGVSLHAPTSTPESGECA